MALTPEEWLDRLALQMDERAARLARLRSYMDGNAPLPEGAEGCRDAYQAFQRKARTNFGELVVDAVVERLIPSGFSVGGRSEDDDQVRSIWRRNRLQLGVSDVLRDMIGLSTGYMMVGESAPREAVVTCERPEQVITEQSATRPDQVRAGMKVYRDPIAGMDVAYVHPYPGEVYRYVRPFVDYLGRPTVLHTVSGGWKEAGAAETGLDFIPIFPFVNRGGLGEFESHTDLLDSINWQLLQILVIIAMQAYRQRAVKGDVPDEDDEGKPLDYNKIFKPGPGALWFLPDGVELWESQTTDISSALLGVKDTLTRLAAVTRTPMSTLIPDGANQSAEGASFAKEGLVFKAGDRRERATVPLAGAMGAALAIEQGQSSIVDDVEVLWLPVERQSLAERADAASKAQDLPWRTRMTDIWQFSADRVDQMESERAADALNAALAFPTQPVTSGTPAA